MTISTVALPEGSIYGGGVVEGAVESVGLIRIIRLIRIDRELDTARMARMASKSTFPVKGMILLSFKAEMARWKILKYDRR